MFLIYILLKFFFSKNENDLYFGSEEYRVVLCPATARKKHAIRRQHLSIWQHYSRTMDGWRISSVLTSFISTSTIYRSEGTEPVSARVQFFLLIEGQKCVCIHIHDGIQYSK
jgi:hypothetical protein